VLCCLRCGLCVLISTDASRFLAQSQSRISFAAPEDRRSSGDIAAQRQRSGGWRSNTTSRPYAQRGVNPYQPSSSQLSGFPFASRLNPPPQAPLFYSATDEFREENDEEEHEREIADFYALQRSRRQLGGSDLTESSEAADESASSLEGSGQVTGRSRAWGKGGGIRSSWRGGVTSGRGRGAAMEDVEESPSQESPESVSDSTGRLMDVGLEDTMRSDADDEPPEDLMEDPPSIQHLRKPRQTIYGPVSDSQRWPADTAQERLLQRSGSPTNELESVPEVVAQLASSPPRHDAFWGHIYLLAFAAMWTTWFLVFLHTAAPATKQPLGDTIYTTLHGSFHLLAIYTFVAIFVSLFWLAALRSYVRHLVYGILVAVPVILYSFSLYPFISSYHGYWHGTGVQDYVMRWGSLVPAITATLWLVAVIRSRLAMQKAISILEFATKILAAHPALLAVGFAVLGSIVGFTWIWLSMFTRVFLGGHLVTRSSLGKFVIDASTWWLGVYFIVVYLWTIGLLFGMQRSITSATVSQWYFHRLAVPAPTSQTIVKAALNHSATTLFGTIALSTGLSLMIRLPLLVLPRRLTMLLGIAMYSLIPSPIVTLINPLTLTYAAIHSQSLAVSSRGLSQMHFLTPNDATTSLHPNTFNNKRSRDGWSGDASPLLPYRLAKLLLHATRFAMSMALGYGGWVSTARTLKLAGTGGVRGSVYAYIVGLVAGAIGWGILGAMEGVLACIVDAVVVCWGSEVGSSGRGEVRYCREAGYLFGDDDAQALGRVGLV